MRFPICVALVCAAWLMLACSGANKVSGPVTAEKVLADAADVLNDPESNGLTSYRGTATLTGPTRDLEYLGIAEELRVRTVEVSYRSPDRQRLSMRTESPAIEAGEELLFVRNEDTLWSFDSQLMEYSENPSETKAYLPYPYNPSFLAGGNIGNALGELEEQADLNAEIVGEETVLDRDAYVIEVSPIVGIDADEVGDETPIDPASNVMRLWIDKENLFTLRLESPIDADQGDLQLEYTEIEFNGDVPDSDFHFDPPPEAERVEPEDSEGSSSHMTPGEAPPGFLNPAYRPEGYQGTGVGSSETSSGERQEADTTFGSEDGELVIRQRVRRDGMPEALQQGETVDVNSLDAWLSEASDIRSLSWRQGDLVIQITADALAADELLRIARSMELVP